LSETTMTSIPKDKQFNKKSVVTHHSSRSLSWQRRLLCIQKSSVEHITTRHEADPLTGSASALRERDVEIGLCAFTGCEPPSVRRTMVPSSFRRKKLARILSDPFVSASSLAAGQHVRAESSPGLRRSPAESGSMFTGGTNLRQEPRIRRLVLVVMRDRPIP